MTEHFSKAFWSRVTIIFLFLQVVCVGLNAQVNGNDYCLSSPTEYTTLIDNDSIYFYTLPNSGSLTASPPSGIPGWNFTWQQFNTGTNSWIAYSTENGVPESTISNLAAGGYRVSITDGNGTIVGCYAAWISEFESFPSVDVEPIPAGCGAVSLIGTIDYGSATPYYNAPPDPMIIDANTEITVCFTANHTFVSDLGFYLRGPATCGSPIIPLATSPGVCNGGNNLNDLCFSTESAANFNVCTAATPLTGTFGSFGAGNTPINWAPLYGCDATTPGWTVQIYDCVGIDVGSLTGASISFNGTSVCGEELSLLYTTPAGFNSGIADNSCSPQTASIFTVPVPPLTELNPLQSCGLLWTADPPFFIPDSTTSLNILLDPGPTQSTSFTLSIVCDDDENIITSCGSGNTSDTEFYAYLDDQLDIEDPGPVCDGDAINLIGLPAGGIWSGDAVDPDGLFSPVGPGDYVVNYTFNNPCSNPVSRTITVLESTDNFSFFDGGVLCPYDAPVFIEDCAQPGNCNTTSNPAITLVGGQVFFDPALASPGPNSYEAEVMVSECASNFSSATFTVEEVLNAQLLSADVICENDAPLFLEVDVPGGSWAGPGIADPILGLFDPSDASAGTILLSYTTPGICPVDENFQVEVIANPIVELGPDLTLCDGEQADIVLNGNWDSITWINELNEEFNGPLIQVNEAGSWQLTAEAGGCAGTDEISVAVTPIPIIDLGPDLELCAGNSELLIAPFEGSWSDNSFGAELEVNEAGTYTYVYDNFGCPTGDEVEVSIIPLVEPAISAIDPLCQDAPVFQLEASIPGGNWSGTGIVDAASGEFDAQLSGAGIITVEYAIPVPCAISDSYEIEVVAPLDLAISPVPPLCVDAEAYELEAAVGGGTWSGTGISDPLLGQFEAELSGAGIFDMTYTLEGVCLDIGQISIEVQEIPELILSDPGLICSLDAPLTLEANLPGGGWSGNGITNPDNGIFDPQTAGSGDHLLTYQLDAVCSVSEDLNLVVTPNPVIDLGPDLSICDGEIIQVDAGSNWDSVEWLGFGNDNAVDLNEEGTYTIVVETDGCFGEDEIELEVILYPEINLPSPIELCEGDVYTIEAPFDGNWSNGEVNTSSIEVGSSGIYTYTLPNDGCPVIEEVEIAVLAYPEIILPSSVEFCPGEGILVLANQELSWSGIAEGEGEEIFVDQEGSLIGEASNGPCTTVEVLEVIELPLPVADLGPDIEGCLGDNYVLNTDNPANSDYLWSTGDEGIEFIIVNESGTYSVTSSNVCGFAIDELTVVLEDCSPLIYLPNSFTPNGDGINDEWFPIVRNLQSFEIVIVNRWGEVVFESKDWDRPWLGEFREGNHYVELGVYVYRLKYTSIEGDADTLTGHITVVR